MEMEFRRITIEPAQMGGPPCIRGLRIPVATVVGMVAVGMTHQEILNTYPDLEREDTRESLRYESFSESNGGLAVLPGVSVEGLGSGQVVGIFGADAMQALLLGLHTIPGQLAPYVRDPGGTFMYLGHPDSSFVDSCRTVLEYAGAAFPPEQG